MNNCSWYLPSDHALGGYLLSGDPFAVHKEGDALLLPSDPPSRCHFFLVVSPSVSLLVDILVTSFPSLSTFPFCLSFLACLFSALYLTCCSRGGFLFKLSSMSPFFPPSSDISSSLFLFGEMFEDLDQLSSLAADGQWESCPQIVL